MLNSETKRKIDALRDTLVGKIPTPTGQVEQITLALIYKFMSDIDEQNKQMGGKQSFFDKEYKQYAWKHILDMSLSGIDRVTLYSEGLQKMSLNPNIPQLFRDIFKNAFLNFRDPTVLNLFLKQVDDFQYSSSEDLGDAFEYLLSVLGSQGDAGQFRTPRHIIDFIVRVVDPDINDRILDPACGTAGFLLYAYKYLIEKYQKDEKNQQKSGLKKSEREKLTRNFVGYDITPEFCRLSRVNMYLHYFSDPKIFEYDTLSSLDRWNDDFETILANPPFMTPKGGIRPHKKFSVQAKKSEVLFVDYIAEHLTPNGKAGIVVPEGIIFTSTNAYKALRKMLVDGGYLYAVLSLPAGVFNPYSGVKTSIFFLDKVLAKKAKDILFIKIANDGFDLGAQRRQIEKDDLPEAMKIIKQYKQQLIAGQIKPSELNKDIAILVSKEKIAKDGDYNLSGDRYKEIIIATNTKWPMVELWKKTEIEKGSPITQKDVKEGTIPVIAGGQSPAYFHNKSNRTGKTITVSSSGAYAGYLNYFKQPIFASDCTTIKSSNEDELNTDFLFFLLKSRQQNFYKFQQGMGQPHVYAKDFKNLRIPLPPIEVQNEIVAELESYQKIIDGASMVVESYKPEIKINPEWEMMELGSVCEFEYGKPLKEENRKNGEYPVYGSNGIVGYHNEYIVEGPFIIIGRKGSAGSVVFSEKNGYPIDTTFFIKLSNENKILLRYLFFLLPKLNLKNVNVQSGVPGLNRNDAYKLKIHVPPLDIQKQIVSEIEEEQKLVVANKRLIEIYQQKIQDKISEVWNS